MAASAVSTITYDHIKHNDMQAQFFVLINSPFLLMCKISNKWIL